MPLSPLDAQAAAPSVGSGRVKVEGLVAVVLVLAAFILLIRTSFLAYLYAPYADAVDWAASVFQVERSHAWLTYLWSPHTDQRIPWVRVLELVAVDGPAPRWPAFLAGDLAAWLAGAAALGVVIARTPLSLRTRIWIGGAAALLWTNAGLAEDFAFPVFSVYLLVTGPALAAAASMATARRDGLGSIAFWVALVFAAVASGGNAAGLMIWPALFALAVLQGRDRLQVFAIVIGGAACIAAMEAGLGLPSRSLDRATGDAAAHLLKMGAYFCIFAGLPWSRSIRWVGVAVALGAVIWAFAARLALRARHDRDTASAPLVGVGVALIAFGLLTAVLATLGRVDELPQPLVPTRYTPFATLLQVGVLLCCAPGLERGARPAWAPRALLVALAVLVLARDMHDAQIQLRSAARVRAASDVFDRTGEQSAIVIYPDPARATSVRRQLAARGRPY